MRSPAREALILRFTAPLLFALTASATKGASAAFSTFEITLLRSSLNLCMTIALLLSSAMRGSMSVTKLLRPGHPLLLLTRGVVGSLAIVCYTESLARLPLTIALTISRLHPFLGGLLSAALLGEPFRASQLPPIVIGMAGVCLVATSKDSGGGDKTPSAVGVALALAAAAFTAAAFTAVRALHKRGEQPILVILAFNFVGCVMSAIKIFWAEGGDDGRNRLRVTSALAWTPHSEEESTGGRASAIAAKTGLLWIFAAAATMQAAQHSLTRLLALQPTAQGATSSFLTLAWLGCAAERVLRGTFPVCMGTAWLCVHMHATALLQPQDGWRGGTNGERKNVEGTVRDMSGVHFVLRYTPMRCRLIRTSIAGESMLLP